MCGKCIKRLSVYITIGLLTQLLNSWRSKDLDLVLPCDPTGLFLRRRAIVAMVVRHNIAFPQWLFKQWLSHSFYNTAIIACRLDHIFLFLRAIKHVSVEIKTVAILFISWSNSILTRNHHLSWRIGKNFQQAIMSLKMQIQRTLLKWGMGGEEENKCKLNNTFPTCNTLHLTLVKKLGNFS